MLRVAARTSTIALCLLLVGCATAGGASIQPSQAPGSSSSGPSTSQTAASVPAASPPTGFERVISPRYPYAVGVPAFWASSDMGSADLYSSSAGVQVDVRYYPAIPEDRAAWFRKAADVLSGFAPIDDEHPYQVAGNEARWFELHPSKNRRELLLIRVTFVAAGDGWDITWLSNAGVEAGDRTTFSAILNTFELIARESTIWTQDAGTCFVGSMGIPAIEAGRTVVFVGPVEGFGEVSCDQPHAGEVIAVMTTPGADCDGPFGDYVGLPIAQSGFALLKFVPDPSAGVPTGVTSICVVTDPQGSMTESVHGSRR
jgi:hypothetical protein